MTPLLSPPYIAGMLDADGSVGFNKALLRLTVTNLSVPLMTALVESMGGTYHPHHKGICAAGCELEHVHVRQVIYGWMLGGERAAVVLRGCLPFLVVKRERAALALEEWERSCATMTRPSRRVLHMQRSRAEMAARGWPDPTAPPMPVSRCLRGHVRTGTERNGACRDCARERVR